MTINCVGSLLRKGLAHYERPPGQRQRDPGWRRRAPQIALYRGHGTQVRSNGRVQSRTGIGIRSHVKPCGVGENEAVNALA